LGTPEEIALRSKVLRFEVDKPAFLLTEAPAFVPHANQTFLSRTLHLNLLADDVDPFDPANPPAHPGGPSATKVLRWNVRLRGVDGNGAPVSYSPFPEPGFTPQLTVTVPDYFAGTNATVDVQLCDCAHCETQPGSGRCVDYSIPIHIPSAITPTWASVIAAVATPERVHLSWQVGVTAAVRVERRESESSWHSLGAVTVDDAGRTSFDDRAVDAGGRYGYRLAIERNGTTEGAGESWVDIPTAQVFELEGARPNPSKGSDFTVSFTLATTEPARLEIVDTAGRRMLERDLGSMGPGRHTVELGRELSLRPGIYLLRLTQGRSSRIARAAVLN